MSKSSTAAMVAPVVFARSGLPLESFAEAYKALNPTSKAPKAPKAPATAAKVTPDVTITVGLTPAQLAAGFAVGAKMVGLADLIGADHTTRVAAMFAESRLFLTLAVLAPDSKLIKSDTVRDYAIKVNKSAASIDAVAFGDLLCKGRRIVRKLAESFDHRGAILAECERLLCDLGSMSAIRDLLFTAPAGDQQRKSVFTLTTDKVGDGKTFTVAELQGLLVAVQSAITSRKATTKVA